MRTTVLELGFFLIDPVVTGIWDIQLGMHVDHLMNVLMESRLCTVGRCFVQRKLLSGQVQGACGVKCCVNGRWSRQPGSGC